MSGRQHGFVTRGQLLALGLSASAIARRTDLIAVHRGVYAVGHAERTPVARAHAAVLACGTAAVLSYDSAAALWGVRRWPHTPEVTAPGKRARAGIAAHRCTTVRRHDITTHYGIRVTTIVRTIVDIAPRLTDRQLGRAINEARLDGYLKPTHLAELLHRCSRAQTLVGPTQNPTRSPPEDAFLAFTKRYGLPTPRINVMVNGKEVDALFEAERVIVELDSWTFHGDPISFRGDRVRDTESAVNGYLPLRLLEDRLGGQTAEQLRQIFRQRRP